MVRYKNYVVLVHWVQLQISSDTTLKIYPWLSRMPKYTIDLPVMVEEILEINFSYAQICTIDLATMVKENLKCSVGSYMKYIKSTHGEVGA